jgi:DnaJ-class molecular chaperone
MDFHERKAERKLHYETYIKGWKLKDCVACNGSGRYDIGRSPKCGSCGGTGKVKYKPYPLTNLSA